MNEVISKEVYEKLKKELERLKKIERREIADKIKQAKEFGDLSENSEYQSALEEQKKLERKIFELETLLKNAKIIKNKPVSKDKISIGSEVEIINLDNQKVIKLKIVGFGESDPLEGKISSESPIAKALLGRKKGEIVEVVVGHKKSQYKIKSIK
jgi:transcription elongation factor GreA